MNDQESRFLWLQKLTVVFAAALILAGRLFAQSAPSSVNRTLSKAEQEVVSKIDTNTIKDVTAALSTDEMQGRGVLQPGGEKAAAYIADRFRKLGLKPLGDNSTYLQQIKFKETLLTPGSVFNAGNDDLKLGVDF